jgi:hypothetical protein
MQVVVPALLDGFACGDADCACRRAQRLANATMPAAGQWPFRDAEQALWQAADQVETSATSPWPEDFLDFPLAAVRVGDDVEVYLASLCPAVRGYLLSNHDPVDLLRRPDGWHLPLRAFVLTERQLAVAIDTNRRLPWSDYRRLRESLLDILADAEMPMLARWFQVLAQLVAPPAVPVSGRVEIPPLTPRAFLHVRGQLEARLAAQQPQTLATIAVGARHLFAELDTLNHGTAAEAQARWQLALAGDWRAVLVETLAPQEASIQPLLETLLSVQCFAIPLARDVSLERAAACWLESVAVGLRLLCAVAWHSQQQPSPAVWLACLALADSAVAVAETPLPAVVSPPALHDRGPRMVDLDLTLASLA